jgi:hypothetical protein
MRALYWGRENRITLSVREAAARLGVSVRPARNALLELLDRGFVAVVQQGGFSCKLGAATVYRLTTELGDEGMPASNEYMHWRPREELSGDAETTTGSATASANRPSSDDTETGLIWLPIRDNFTRRCSK